MQLATMIVAVFCLAGCVCAAPSVKHDGGVWILDNEALRVDIFPSDGRYQVLDKTAGYLWKGPDRPVIGQPPKLMIPRLTREPVVDGDVTDWSDGNQAMGVEIALTPDMVAHARDVRDAQDLSARLRVGWTPRGLWLAVCVLDEQLTFPGPEEAQWWERDSVEFWVNDRQYAVRFGPWGANLWSAVGRPLGLETAFLESTAPAGYSVEVFIPAEAVTHPRPWSQGGAFRFALGINDSDGEKRQGQLYYPTTWVHSDPDTFALAVLADERGELPADTQPPRPPQALTPVGDVGEGSVSFDVTATAGASQPPLRLTFALDGDRPDLLITAQGPAEDAPTGRFGVLHPLVLDRPGGRILGAQYCNGIGVPTDDMGWAGREWTTWSTLDMPWVGLTDGDLGYMLLWELPVSCDNGSARFERVQVGDRTLLAPGVYHYPIKGTYGPPRTVRYSFCAQGGHVAICKRYRQYAREHGFLVTQKEKLQRKPELAKLPGAPDVWGRSDLQFCREAKAAGIERLMVNGPQSAEDMEAIKALGFLISTYDNYEDAHEGDPGNYGDFNRETDAVVMADGRLMTAWLTHDDPPKQFMKRCTALFTDVARRWIPRDLQAHPYNARFLDVTTACGLIECYSEAHGLTRTEDRHARRRLAQYVGDELGLVLGGEHGRWYGADIYNYWEGMQSGGFYSWPAGYVGENIPQTREEIGREYLEWGLGEKNRYPLWELVFHDCVVSTWYWGDSTGHLIKAAPELGYKQDAFNVLYGTVPLFWNNQPYSYDWSKRWETRPRFLESYRNTCKLHEAIGFEEMVSHQFVTTDRAVQKTVFGDGTQVWVNFGQEPWTLTFEGQEYVLPQYGFFAKGPKIELMRIQRAWTPGDFKDVDEEVQQIGGLSPRPDAPVTLIRTPDYLHVTGSWPGLVESFLGTPVTVKREGPARLRVIPEGAKWARINWKALCPDAGEGPWRLAELDAQGNPLRIGAEVVPRGEMLLLPIGEPMDSPLVLLGPSAVAAMTELVTAVDQDSLPVELNQGDPLHLSYTVTNVGGTPARDVVVALYQGAVAPENRLAEQTVTVPGYTTVPVVFNIADNRYDGHVTFVVKADDQGAVTELCKSDNVASATCAIRPDWAQWDTSLDVTVDMGPVSRFMPVVQMPFDPQVERAQQGKAGPTDLRSIRVMRLDRESWQEALCPSQMATDPQGNPVLMWELTGRFNAGETVRCRIYLDGAQGHGHVTATGSGWSPQEQVFRGYDYEVRFRDGYIRGLKLRTPAVELFSSLGVSSKDTGWVEEMGQVKSFEVISDGPVCTQIRVKKDLNGGHFYDKLYTLYRRGGLTVTTLSPERFGSLSRAYVLPDCEFADDKGHRTRVDGKGEGEGIIGQNPDPRWYALWSDNGDWALTCVAVTPHQNITYWDGGAKGGISLDTWRSDPATVAYVFHNKADENQEFAGPEFAELDYERIQQPVTVRR